MERQSVDLSQKGRNLLVLLGGWNVEGGYATSGNTTKPLTAKKDQSVLRTAAILDHNVRAFVAQNLHSALQGVSSWLENGRVNWIRSIDGMLPITQSTAKSNVGGKWKEYMASAANSVKRFPGVKTSLAAMKDFTAFYGIEAAQNFAAYVEDRHFETLLAFEQKTADPFRALTVKYNTALIKADPKTKKLYEEYVGISIGYHFLRGLRRTVNHGINNWQHAAGWYLLWNAAAANGSVFAASFLLTTGLSFYGSWSQVQDMKNKEPFMAARDGLGMVRMHMNKHWLIPLAMAWTMQYVFPALAKQDIPVWGLPELATLAATAGIGHYLGCAQEHVR